jgi:hypothetical protein
MAWISPALASFQLADDAVRAAGMVFGWVPPVNSVCVGYEGGVLTASKGSTNPMAHFALREITTLIANCRLSNCPAAEHF